MHNTILVLQMLPNLIKNQLHHRRRYSIPNHSINRRLIAIKHMITRESLDRRKLSRRQSPLPTRMARMTASHQAWGQAGAIPRDKVAGAGGSGDVVVWCVARNAGKDAVNACVGLQAAAVVPVFGVCVWTQIWESSTGANTS
jgi:hypothetical protein